MRILHAITTLDIGGAEMHLLAQVRGQIARGHRVRVGYLKGAGTLRGDFLAAGAEWVGRLSLAHPVTWVRAVRWAQVVHTHLLKADAAVGAVAALLGRRRALISGKHNDERALLHPLVSNAHRLVGNLPRVTIPLSDHVQRYIATHGHVPDHKQRRIYYGLDRGPYDRATSRPVVEREALRAELGARPDDVVFICVARFAPQKAHDVLLRAFAGALSRGAVRLRLWLVGDDPFGSGRREVERLAAELSLGEAVRFTGVRRDVPELLAASDVFVMASHWEGLGLVFLEAMAAGLPVVATDVSAVPEVVAAERSGILVPPADAGALAAAMVRLADAPAERAALGNEGRRIVSDSFGLDGMVERTLEVYAELLGRR